MITALHEGWRRARIAHECDLCFAAIQPGERYYADVYICDDGLCAHKTCEACRRDGIAPRAAAWHDHPADGIHADDVYVWAIDLLDDEPDSPHAPAARAYLARREAAR